MNKYDPPVTTMHDGRGRKGEGSYQKSWLEAQKWICKKCHPPPITKVSNNRFHNDKPPENSSNLTYRISTNQSIFDLD